MTYRPSVTFCITIMNRLDQLKRTLAKNLYENSSQKVDFLILDYNSDDGCGDWVFKNFKNYIDEGVLTYFRTTEPYFFDRSHSKNIAFKLAKGDIVCNLDADNFAGKDFFEFILREFNKNQNIFLTVSSRKFNTNNRGEWISGQKDLIGRIALKKTFFMKLNLLSSTMTILTKLH